MTGAGQGIGLAIVTALSFEGAEIWALDRHFAADRLPAGINRVLCDITDDASVERAVAEVGAFDVLVNCAGMVAVGTILDSSLDDLDASYRVNVRGMAAVIRALLPGMIARGGGSIINIASVVSSVMAAPNRFAYAATKAAVIGLTKSVALDFVKQGIRCNAISPGTVETPSLHARWAATGDPVAAQTVFVARQPMGRLGASEEIAAAAVMLASDDVRFMTGANLIIDGGMSL